MLLPCPNCRYDLAGHLHGNADLLACPECGESTSRTELLSWSDAGLAWSIEHTRRLSFRRWLATSLRILRPASFWKRLLEAPSVRPRRWTFFALLWLLFLYVGVLAVFIITFIANQLIVQGAYTGAPRFDLLTIISRPGWWWPFNKLLFVQTGPSTYVGTPVWSLLLPSLPLLLIPPLCLYLFRSFRLLPALPLRFHAAIAGSFELVALWSIGIPLSFAAAILLRTALGLDHAHLIRVLPGLWMLAALAHLGCWWYAAARTTSPPARSALASVLSLVAAIAGFFLLLLGLEAAGAPV